MNRKNNKYDGVDGPDYAIFLNYKALKGKHSLKTFLINLSEFYGFTFDAYILGKYEEGGPDSREEAYSNWVTYIKSKTEAKRYFEAVDNFSSYS